MNPIRNSAKAIIVADERLLTIKLQDEEGLFYILPGGGQYPGETLTDALRRECREELAVDIDIRDLVCMREYIGKNHEFTKDTEVHQIEFMFACSLQDGASVEMGGEPDQQQVGFEWIPLDQLEAYRFYPKAIRRLLGENEERQHSTYLGDLN